MNRITARRLGLRVPRSNGGWRSNQPLTGGSRFSDSTNAEVAWDRTRAGSLRWSLAGAFTGALVALVGFAPAAWLASAVSAATQQRFVLTDARGTIWSGNAVTMVTGGAGSRDASALPGRLAWSMHPQGLGMRVQLRQACCLNGDVAIALKPSLAGLTASVQPQGSTVGQWPAAWLSGLGTPWNTIQLGGVIRVLSSGVTFESTQGQWGSYRLSVRGASPGAAGTDAEPSATGGVQFTLSTLEGTLQLRGSGAWARGKLRFQGEARSSDADDAALTNLLNIIGRREGARSVISIG